MFLHKGVLKICSKFTGENSCGSVISLELQSNFIAITLRRGRSPLNLQHIFRKPFLKNTSRGLLLQIFLKMGPYDTLDYFYGNWIIRFLFK